MSWFSRQPKSDPIGDICQSLAEKSWEWTSGTTEDDGGDETPTLEHMSGVMITWRLELVFHPFTSEPSHTHNVWLAHAEEGAFTQCDKQQSKRLYAATQACAAAKIKRPKFVFTDTAKQLAKAILETQDEAAAYALADEVMQYAQKTR